MKLIIRGNKIEITEAIRAYIKEKTEKLDKYFENPDSLEASIVARISGNDQIIEVTIPYKQITLRAEERNKDLYVAITEVIEKLERQIRKNKTRMSSKQNQESIKGFIKDIATTLDLPKETIVKRKQVEVKPMSEEEAILQMNLIDHDFYIFTHEDTNKAAVIYKRKDGNYGVIETI